MPEMNDHATLPVAKHHSGGSMVEWLVGSHSDTEGHCGNVYLPGVVLFPGQVTGPLQDMLSDMGRVIL